MFIKTNSSFTVVTKNEMFVLIVDNDEGMSVTNDAVNVLKWLNCQEDGPLGKRTVYYRDSTGAFDILEHVDGNFTDFRACPEHVREALTLLVDKYHAGVL
ncbi:hypothetical protein AGJ34_20365 [Cronobacter dublinensis subsp. dublinensis]|nr:hypothetical protein [Cronobacter dublinensis subsp. dublinensis]EGT5729940.1 hypothetical protein [Cronobacter dublinensis subsp. dublinensis]